MEKRIKKGKVAQGLVTRTIHYRDRRDSHSQDRTLRVDIRRGERIEEQQATAMVTVRTGIPLSQVQIIEVI